MELNRANLTLLGRAFSTAYQEGLGMAETQYTQIATTVPSSTKEQDYGWLGKLPKVREWIGDRVIQNASTANYSIKNKPYELTIGVERDDIKDDNIGIYGPLFQEFGSSVAAFPDEMIFGLLKTGFSTPCYDGQNFFDTDHPVLDGNGAPQSVANTDADAGDGEPWFLMSTRRPLKPLIYQLREPFTFVAKDRVDDDNVFFQKEFIYGTDGRSNVGFGFWQMAWGSMQPLTAANYAAARAALMNLTGDYGRPLGMVPNLLVTGPSNEGAGRTILKAQVVDATTNAWFNSADLLVSPWLQAS